jgi:OOP family OmpA-OmpF porin
LREHYGDRLCIYTVLIGDDPHGRNLLDALTRVGTCGMATDAKKLGSAAGMQDFVRTVFFEPAKIVPKPAPVAAKGPKDSDGDGVTDDRDACPGTPPGGRVDANGCWEAGMVHFDFDKADIKAEYTALLDEVARMMQQYSYLKLGIHGHTDNMGPEVYNQHLSVKRAEAVRAYLTAAGVAEWRFAVEGFGLTQPIATNDTREGRATNRRGEMKQMP